MFDPLQTDPQQAWSPINKPSDFDYIQGDIPSSGLKNGHVLFGSITGSPRTADWDPCKKDVEHDDKDPTRKYGWKEVGAGTKDATPGEETWTLLPDGSVLTVEVSPSDGNMGRNPAERYLPDEERWIPAGFTGSHRPSEWSSTISRRKEIKSASTLGNRSCAFAGRWQGICDRSHRTHRHLYAEHQHLGLGTRFRHRHQRQQLHRRRRQRLLLDFACGVARRRRCASGADAWRASLAPRRKLSAFHGRKWQHLLLQYPYDILRVRSRPTAIWTNADPEPTRYGRKLDVDGAAVAASQRASPLQLGRHDIGALSAE